MDRDIMAPVLGEWEIFVNVLGLENGLRVTLSHGDNGSLVGQMARGTLDGSFNGETINLVHRQGSQVVVTLCGKLSGDQIKGQGVISNRTVDWRASRPSPQHSAAQHHVFRPQKYAVFLGLAQPVLRLFPGDHVVTETVDSRGVDRAAIQRGHSGSALTGPFFIEGALPGDTLAVKIERLHCTRDWAESSGSVLAAALPTAFHEILLNRDAASPRWKLDAHSGTATLDTTDPRLARHSVPLNFSLGTIGVAPPGHEKLLPMRAGNYGGDLDCPFIREGTTVFLPVHHPGAFLYVGDGHGAQAEGEITGDGLEVPMEVEFSVEVRRDYTVWQPRVVDQERLTVIGVAPGALEALQGATGELGRWLTTDYNLSTHEVAIILSSFLQYSVCKFAGRSTVVCAHVPKARVSNLAPLSEESNCSQVEADLNDPKAADVIA